MINIAAVTPVILQVSFSIKPVKLIPMTLFLDKSKIISKKIHFYTFRQNMTSL